MRASARVEVVRDGGRDVLADVRSEPPLTLRRAGDRVLVVGSAAGPLGGDDLTLDVSVGPDARLALGTVAASMVWPGPHDEWSRQRVDVTVDQGGRLEWAPEPLVLVAGCRHRSATHVRLAAGASAWIVEEIALGRRGEVSGSMEAEWRIEREGAVLLHHAERFGPAAPGWGSAVTAGHHRHVLAAISVGRPCPPQPPLVCADVALAVLQLADDAWIALAVGADRVAVARACADVLSVGTGPIGPVRNDSSDQAGSLIS